MIPVNCKEASVAVREAAREAAVAEVTEHVGQGRVLGVVAACKHNENTPLRPRVIQAIIKLHRPLQTQRKYTAKTTCGTSYNKKGTTHHSQK